MTLLTAVILVAAMIGATAPPLAFTWRWPALTLLVGIVCEIGVLILLARRSRPNTASVFWFAAFNAANLSWQVLNLFQELSTTPEAASYWQGIMPLVAVPIATSLLYFVITYVDGIEFPRSPALRWMPFVIVPVIAYVSGRTNLIESHIPRSSQLEYWGYQSAPGPLEIVIVVWALGCILVALLMLVRYYHQTTSQTIRQQTRVFIAAIAVYLVCAATIDFGLYLINPHILPPMSFVYTIIMSVIIMYGIEKYGLFALNPAAQSEPILENLSEGIIGVDVHHMIQFSNTSAEIMLERSRSELAGLSTERLFDRKTYRRLEQGLQQSDDTIVIEGASILDAAEHRIPATITASRLRDDKQRMTGYILVVQNMTELHRKAVELAREKASVERKVVLRTRELHDEEAKLRASIESLNSGFALADADGVILEQNHAFRKILNLDAAPKTLSEASRNFIKFNLQDQSQRVHAEARPIATDDVVLDSKILWAFAAPVNTLVGESVKIIGTVVLVEDFTEVKVMQRSRDEFFSIASHELRTPLTAIKGNASMLLQYFGDSFKQGDSGEMLQDIHDSSERLIAIVSDFLDASRLEQGKLKFEAVSLQLEPIIEKTVYEMKVILREKGLSLNLDSHTLDVLPPVLADPARLKQVVYNLVGNALIYTAKGAVDIRAEVHPTFVKVYIRDSGRGISKDAQHLLFHKFQQAGESLYTRDSTRGTGLGLYISKLMIEKMGGTIQLEESTVGKGSTFSFTVPRADTESASGINRN